MGSKHNRGGVPYSAAGSKRRKGGPYRGVSKQNKGARSSGGTAPDSTAPQGQAAMAEQTIPPQGQAETSEQPVAPQETAREPAPQEQPKKGSKRHIFSIYNIIGVVLCILLLPGFIISMTLLFSSMIHRDAPPSCFGYTPLMVETGSMSPVFDANDLVLIQNTDDDATYNAGDIICFHSGNAYITHRIKEVTTDANGNTVYITQGDANNAPDAGSVRPDQILGVYKTHLDGMGGVFVFIQTPTGMIVCVVLPIVLVLLLFFVPPMLAAKKKNADKNE